jgi:hypothetical protein
MKTGVSLKHGSSKLSVGTSDRCFLSYLIRSRSGSSNSDPSDTNFPVSTSVGFDNISQAQRSSRTLSFLMAEFALYGNTAEPAFPFHLVTPKLKWLAQHLAEREPSTDHFDPAKYDRVPIIPLLDTVLVFGRARTASLENSVDLRLCRGLIKRLNAVLVEAGPEASYHKLEIFRQDITAFQITCANSPRFDWNIKPTQRNLGRNLDFFAAGQIYGKSELPKRHPVHFIETRTMHCVLAEMVPWAPLDDPTTARHFKEFNDRKERLMNDTMKSFELPYRFKWVCYANTDPVFEDSEGKEKLGLPVPTSQWWTQNCFYLNRYIRVVKICSYATQYERHWSLIQKLCNWTHTLNHSYFYEQKSSKDWEVLFDLFRQVKCTMEQEELTTEEVLALELKVNIELERVVAILQIIGPSKKIRVQRPPENVSVLDVISSEFVRLGEYLKWVTSQRRRRRPLVFECFPNDPNSDATKPAYCSGWQFRRRWHKARKLLKKD